MPNGFRSAKCRWIVLTLCWFGAACSQLEITHETHTAHVIDYGAALPDGVKIADPEPTEFVLYKDGAVVGEGRQVFNGMMVLPPSRYWTLLGEETALADLAAEAVDGKLAARIEATAKTIAAERGGEAADFRDVAFGQIVQAALVAADVRMRPK